MRTTDLFKFNRSAKRLNESLAKTFGKKLNLETFSIEQLEDARNKLRTQIYTARSSSGFNETVENDALSKAQFMHDAIVAELTERDEPIVDNTQLEGRSPEVEEFLTKVAQSGDDGFDMLYGAQAGKYGKEIEQAVQEMYDDITIDTGYHGDDDFEQIYDRMLDNIEADYGDRGSDDEGGETDDGYALASAGFGSDEDYESIETERVRDPEDWDEGNTEPANNFAVSINGKQWKVFKGRGKYAEDQREQAHYQQLKDWAAKKSADTGKKWTVSITGENPTESIQTELSKNTLQSYQDKAGKDIVNTMTSGDYMTTDKSQKKVMNRMKGSERASDKIDKKNEDAIDRIRDRIGTTGNIQRQNDRFQSGADARHDTALNYQKNRQTKNDAETKHEIDVLAHKLSRMQKDDDDWEKTFDMMRDRMNRYQWSSQRDVDPEQLKKISDIKYEPRKKNETAQAKTDDKLLAYYAQRKAEKQKKEQGTSGQQDKNESINTGEDMRNLREGEIQQASAIVTAKTMVDRVGRWIEELSGMENDTLLQLGDSIRDEMSQEQAKAFIEAVAPAIQQALETLKTTRDTLSSGVRSLASGEQPMDMLGAEPGAEMGAEMGPAEPDMMNLAEPAGDEFAAAEPAVGGSEAAGREQRESIQRSNNLLKMLAG